MQPYNSTQWINDIDAVSKNLLSELAELDSKTVLVTGASGLICSSVVDIIIRYNETHSQSIGIIVAGRDEAKMRNRFGCYFDRSYFNFLQYDATSLDNNLHIKCDYIIHGAGNAYPSIIAQEPVESLLSNFIGVNCLLEYAKEQQVKKLLYISSSEVYGKKENNQPFNEVDYGFVDILKSRNSYPVSKRAAETLCVSYLDEYDVNAVIVRPGHIYGPTADPNDNRVSSQWAFAAARGENIVMKSDGAQMRSYCYCLDCASAMLQVLLKGAPGYAYNISNPNSIISIKQLAELFAKYGNVKVVSDMPTLSEKAAFNVMQNSSLNSNSLQEIGWMGLFGPQEGIEHTINILREML